ncbi:MAG TPA: hypothetical protein VI451_07745 [Anaerolineales bacterium]|nr:hypothetical protein [Anaerolineales bacterium]
MIPRELRLCLRFLVFICLGWLLGGNALTFRANAEENSYQLFFPLINRTTPLLLSSDPIWVDNDPPLGHEVVLFRATFSRPSQVENIRLHIFADTRYEVWIDGQWLGRGPTRFTTTYHEYDIYPLEPLGTGTHQIAVLVQWSPDSRRSESTTPYLQAVIIGENNQLYQILEGTGPHWKTLVSTAWQAQAALVHPGQLIGFTELMDFREFPWGWTQPAFDDQSWQNAVNLPLSQGGAECRPRSISPLTTQAIPYTILDVGHLSPGMVATEIVPPFPDPYQVNFTALDSTVLTLERLFAPNIPAPTIFLDGIPLTWEPAPTNRPDVQTASLDVDTGPHELLLQQLPSEGFTFNRSSANLLWDTSPFQQGLHAGRRLLLTEYVGAPDVITKENGLLNVTQFPAYIVLEMPRVVHGRISAYVTGPAGTVVDIGWSERLLDNTTRPLPFPGSLFPGWNQTDSWILDGNAHKLTTLDARAGRYILIAIWGSGPVSFQDLQVLEERYPITQNGTFTSSDFRLNQIWQLGVDTAAINMLDAYADPWRERGQWWGDAYVVDHINQVAFGDQSLLRRGLKIMAKGFTDGRPVAMSPNGNALGVYMLDYGMLWAHSLQEYLLRTDDRAFASAHYLTLLHFMDYLVAQTYPQTGLLDLPQNHWSQTAYIDTYSFFDRYGQSTALNSLYYETLLRAAWVADYIGDGEQATQWATTATSIREEINLNLYDPLTHQYAATLYQDQLLLPSVQAQAWALAYGIVPDEEKPFVADSLLALIPNDPATAHISIYGMYWILEGLAQAGRIQDALDLIHLYYGYLLDNGATTLWERFDSNQDHQTSLSHGWGGAPTWFLTTHVAGLQQTSLNSWRATPILGTFDTLSSTLPLPNGILQISWQTAACQTTLTIQAPEDTEGELILLPDTIAITAPDGTSLVYETTGELVLLPLTGGQTTLLIIQPCPDTSHL